MEELIFLSIHWDSTSENQAFVQASSHALCIPLTLGLSSFKTLANVDQKSLYLVFFSN